MLKFSEFLFYRGSLDQVAFLFVAVNSEERSSYQSFHRLRSVTLILVELKPGTRHPLRIAVNTRVRSFESTRETKGRQSGVILIDYLL